MFVFFLNNTHTHKNKHILVYITRDNLYIDLSDITYNKCISLYKIGGADYETKVLNDISHIPSTDTISNITLKCELDLIIFVQIL